MASAPVDPPLFYSRHIFCCTNVRPEGHPRGCCSAGGSEKLRAYMREKAKALGMERSLCQRLGLSRPMRARPEHGDLSRGRLVPL